MQEKIEKNEIEKNENVKVDILKIFNDSILNDISFKDMPKDIKTRCEDIIKGFKDGKNILGHYADKISGKIDYKLISGKHTVKQIAKYASCSESRVNAHIKRDLKKGMRSKGIIKCDVHTDTDKGIVYITLKSLI